MTLVPEVAPTRVERRKARTRAALVEAAQQIYAETGGSDVSIQQITERADVGFGSFYNHFASKTELFDVAVAEILEEHAAWLTELTAQEQDPAAVFATSMRLTGRLVRTRPLMAQVLMNSRFSLLGAGAGHAPHALADITRAAEAGRFTVDDPVLALACTAGCLLAAMSLGSLDGADLDAVVDGATGNVLRMFGVAEDEVRALTALPLPSEDVQAGRA
ncbi:MAG: TetR family transcriptional regulator [Nocardioides sp.]|nr:TetR family transcriptional regulator [Nocardioides sp.]